MARIRDQLDAYADGAAAPPTPLLAHCAAFCRALTRHHTSEDTRAFPTLGARFPELVPVLEQLRQDHVLVADILRRLRQLLATLTRSNTEPVRRELDGLAAILDSHFRWEERRLVDALDTLDAAPPAGELFGL